MEGFGGRVVTINPAGGNPTETWCVWCTPYSKHHSVTECMDYMFNHVALEVS